MKKNYVLDLILLFMGFLCIVTGFALDFHWFGGKAIKGLHTFSGYVLAAGLVLHLIWHRVWIRSVTQKMLRRDSSVRK